MLVPGVNLLSIAQTVIARQELTYYKFSGRAKNEIGSWVSNYDAPLTIYECIQSMPPNLMRELGLSLERSYVVIYSSQTDFTTLKRGETPDIIEFAGRRYKALESNDWVAIDGWEGVIFVDIGSSNDPFPNPVA